MPQRLSFWLLLTKAEKGTLRLKATHRAWCLQLEVKTTNDLFALRSDAYLQTPDYRIELDPKREGVPPDVKLATWQH